MTRPEALTRNEALKWSPGSGADVWEMFTAAISGDLARIQELIARDASLVRCHFRYRKPLYFAVRENRIGVAGFLLARDPDPFGLAVNDSLLEIARDRGYREMQTLIEETMAGEYRASPEGNAIAAGIRERSAERVRALLASRPHLVHAADDRSNQPIHWAAMTRQIDLIDELLARGADINARRKDGARPIHLMNGDYNYRGWRDVPKDVTATPAEVLNHLIALGAYVDIWTAAHTGNLERVRELLDEDPSLANRNSEYSSYYLGSGSALKNAAAGGHVEIIKLLLERGADPNLPEEHIAPQGHALYSAVYHGYYEIARLLLEYGAHPNAEVESSADTLSRAIANSDQPMIDLLCSYGAARGLNLLAYSGDVRTAAAIFAVNPALAESPEALMSAAAQGHDPFVRLMLRYNPRLPERIDGLWFGSGPKTRDFAELLFAHGMNPSHRDWLGVTPLHEFARKGDVENAALYIAHGADLHARDEDICSTPLAWAAKFGKMAMVELLLSHGAKPNLPDDPQWATPLTWATRRGHTDIADLLRRIT